MTVFNPNNTTAAVNTAKIDFTNALVCGEGASCAVYQMRINGLRVAVKRLKQEYRTHPLYVESYRKEFAIGQRLKHDGLPVYRELRCDMDDVYIVMDFIDGVSLEDFANTADGQRYFSSAQNVRRFLKELVSVATYLHRSGVIHCDLKPANIMLRNSDRGVMLIDLDKSYCDVRDLTHGGTPDISAPLTKGTPTAYKDISAIGKIVEWLSSKIKHFPASKFRKFKKLCLNKNTTDDELTRCLQSDYNTKFAIWAVALLVVLISAVVAALFLSRPATKQDSIQEAAEPQSDTIIQVIEPTHADTKISSPIVEIDFDSNMSAFISEVSSASTRLASGNLTNSEITELIYSITESYTGGYAATLEKAKTKNPGVSAIDVELAVAKASERSRAQKLFRQFTQAATDTISARQTD